jgi:hypothetical protein
VPLRPIVRGESGAVYSFIRPNNREPAKDFLDNLPKNIGDKFKGNFDGFTKMGAEYGGIVRFKPLHSYGKPLWEFKEHAPRVYTVREVFALADKAGGGERLIAVAILLMGWTKGKEGKNREEKEKIESALTLYQEYLSAGRSMYGESTPMGTAIERKERLRR